MCDCIKKANKTLAAQHTALTTRTMLVGNDNAKSMKMVQVLTVPTHSTKKGVTAKVVPINFCPLCGEKAA
jgi:hypothetical protein